MSSRVPPPRGLGGGTRIKTHPEMHIALDKPGRYCRIRSFLGDQCKAQSPTFVPAAKITLPAPPWLSLPVELIAQSNHSLV